jgi:hypothetical protein
MRRFRLSTLMLLIVIAALCSTIWVQERRRAVRERQHQVEVAELKGQIPTYVIWKSPPPPSSPLPQSEADSSAPEGLASPGQSGQAPEP